MKKNLILFIFVVIIPAIILGYLDNQKNKEDDFVNPLIKSEFIEEKAELEEEPEPTKPANIVGLASYYSREGCLGCSPTMTMANGEPLDDNRLTVAYNDAPLNSYVKVKNVKTGKVVTAKVTDTGGFKRHGKIIDLTIATRDSIGCGHVCKVEVTHEI